MLETSGGRSELPLLRFVHPHATRDDLSVIVPCLAADDPLVRIQAAVMWWSVMGRSPVLDSVRCDGFVDHTIAAMSRRSLVVLCAFITGACGGDADATPDASTDAAPSPGRDSGPFDAGVGMPQGTCTEPDPAFTAQEMMLIDLPANRWWSAPGTELRPLCPAGADQCPGVIGAWSGGAYDPVHNRMLIFGGGHADYSGNEIYGFDLSTLSWSRLTEPSDPSQQDMDPLADGRPVSRHSYDGLQYITHRNRFFATGGSRWRDGGGTHLTWTFETETSTWRNMMPANEPSRPNCCSDGSAYDPGTGRVFLHFTGSFVSYDYDANRYETIADLGFPPLWPRYEAWGDKRGLVDTRRGLVWFLGADLVMVYDIATDEFVTDDWVTTGGAPFSNGLTDYPEQLFNTTGGEVITASGPGADYDVVADDIVAWVGGGVWALDLETRVWSQGTASGAPADPTSTGTFGRWRYIPRLNVFILVNSVDEPVNFYKHTPRCGI